MKWVLLFMLGGTGVAIVAACVLVLFVRHRINRHHRVAHSVATDAPLTWLVDPRVPARLHRRLAKVGRTAITVGDDHRPTSRRLRRTEPAPPIVEVADDVRDQAVRLDHQLARLALLAPGARQRPLVDLERSVASLERAASGLVALSAEVRAPRALAADHPGLLDLSAQVDRLAEAHQALIDLDAEAGLVAEAPPAPPLTRRQAPG